MMKSTNMQIDAFDEPGQEVYDSGPARRERIGNNKFKPTKAHKIRRAKIAAKSRLINRKR